MFKKKPNIKPLAPLRSSDRRKTADQIIKDLDLKAPINDAAKSEEKAASTAEHTALRNSLLPENSLSARFTTTHGPDLKLVSGTVYVGSHNGDEQRVLWAKINDRMYPTVYTLWHNPGILPLLHTGSFVIEKLRGGADLMTPGLYGGPPFPKKAKAGAIVAVSSAENPSVPLVVGYCEIDVSCLQQVKGAKGHAVRTIHWAGDDLWSWTASGNPGLPSPDRLDGWLDKVVSIDKLDKLAQRLALKEEDGEQDGGVVLGFEEQGEPNGGHEEDTEEVVEMTTKEIDEAFHNAFLYGVHHQKKSHPKTSYFGLSFPLTQSFVMSNLITPFLPAFTASQTAQLQIKKTSWKNMKKFLKSLDKAQIIKTKDQQGNEVVIMDIDFDDAHVVSFVPYKLPKKENSAAQTNGKSTEQPDSSDSSIGQELKIVSLYKPKDKLAPIFDVSKADIREYYSNVDLRRFITTYIELENLIPPTNKRFVTLNPVLANAVFDGKGASDKEIVARGAASREVLIERFVSICSPYHLIQRVSTSSAVENRRPRAGAPPKVLISLETRSGNKTVTKVSGVEAYFIMPQPLADELRKVCAGSTSVEKLQGSSPKAPVMEIMVQGPQKDAVIKALEKRGVDKRWIDVLDKTKKKK